MKFTRGEIWIVAGLTTYTLLVFFLGVTDLGRWNDVVQFCYLLAVPAWLILPMWLAGRHQGWGPLTRPWQEQNDDDDDDNPPRPSDVIK